MIKIVLTNVTRLFIKICGCFYLFIVGYALYRIIGFQFYLSFSLSLQEKAKFESVEKEYEQAKKDAEDDEAELRLAKKLFVI